MGSINPPISLNGGKKNKIEKIKKAHTGKRRMIEKLRGRLKGTRNQ